MVAPLFAQQTDEQLATQYFGNGEYAKAADIYERLNSKNPSSMYFYDNLLQSYLNLKQFDDAEKLTKKQQRRFSENAFYKVDMYYVLKKSGNVEKANKYLDELFKPFKGTEGQTTELSNAFQKRNENDLAIQVYLKARKINNSNGMYAIQLAQLYAQKRDTKLVVDEYLNAIQNNPELIDDVEEYLQLYLQSNQDYDVLKLAVLKKEKENSESGVFSDMLIWLYVQRKDFDNAFIQAKAMDKRNKEDGRRVYELGNMAMLNGNYTATLNIYQYIMQLGKDKPFYLASQVGSLEAKNKKILSSPTISQADLLSLENDYNVFLNQEGRNDFTASTMRDLARFEAYQLHQFDKSIALFKELIDMPRLNYRLKAECKLELGDIYVLKNEVWDAILLYGQVDKDFLEDPLGQEAKFRNARLSYYIGEFEWARAQLDVLKTATSQLIANDALELSLMIQDNTQDSIEEPLLLFAKADLNYFQNKMDVATQLLDSINLLFPKHTLDDDILFKRAQIAEKAGAYDKSISYLDQLVKEYGSGVLGDNALFMMADIIENKLHDKQRALKLYEQFIEQYPGSFYSTEVRRRFRSLRGDVVE